MHFTSDNASGVPDEVLAAIAAANCGYAPSYGADPIMDRVRDRIREIFEAPKTAVYLVATGTAANALSLALFCPPWASVYCHRASHVEQDECGAPEFYTGGAKLVLLDGDHARIDTTTLSAALGEPGPRFVHSVQKGMLSLTNATEAGTTYTPAQVAELTAIARAHDMACHMDGARFANALVALNCTPAELTWKAGIDVLSFGGTKNGLMGVEAVVIFDPDKAWEFELRRKRGAHLFSKHRYLSAQMEAYLTDDLWLRLAGQANRVATRLSQGFAKVPGAHLVHPTEANAVFAAWPRAGHRRAIDAGAAYYLWPMDQSIESPAEDSVSARLVCSWCTTDEDIDAFLAAISE